MGVRADGDDVAGPDGFRIGLEASPLDRVGRAGDDVVGPAGIVR